MADYVTTFIVQHNKPLSERQSDGIKRELLGAAVMWGAKPNDITITRLWEPNKTEGK